MATYHVNLYDIARTEKLPSGRTRTWTRVVSRIIRTETGIEYEIAVEGEDDDDRVTYDGEGGYQMLVWDEMVPFGHAEAFRAGGAAFQAASKEQDHIAELCAVRLRKAT